jgi:hypothetical protein
MEEMLLESLKSLPLFLTSKDLVDLGFYPSLDAAYLGRIRGNTPDYVKMKRKILYPKASVIEYVLKHLRKGS